MISLILSIITMLPAMAMAQTSTLTLSGQLQDKEGNAIPSATITLSMKNDSTNNYRTMSEADGRFKINNIRAGKYRLTVTSIGYDEHKRDLSLAQSTDMGVIRIKDTSTMLDELTVMAEYSKIKPTGETSVMVKGNPLATGKTLVEFLKFVRDIDVSDNGISVRGRANTLFYLDNQAISFEQLKNIPPDMIARIEVIPNADAQYGVNATGGVVKIFLREEPGMLGSASVYGDADYNGVSSTKASVNILYRQGKINIRNFMSGTPYSRSTSIFKQNYVDGDGDTQTDTRNVSRGKSLTDNLSIRYTPNRLTWLDVYGGVGQSWGRPTQNSVSGNDILNTSGKSTPKVYTGGIQFYRFFGKDSLSYVRIRTEYEKNKGNSSISYTHNGVNDIGAQKSNMDVVAVNPILHINFKEYTALNAGLDFSFMQDRHHDRETETLGYIADGNYLHKGYDYGAWVDYSMYLKKKLYIYLSLMYHGTQSLLYDYLKPANNVDRWQDGIYQNIYTQWTINPKKYRYMTLGLRHYFSLPNYFYTLPNVAWQSENLYSKGNPDLRKEDYYTMELYYSLNRKLSASYNLTYCDNMVTVMTFKDESRPDVYYSMPVNAGYSLSHLFRFSYIDSPFKFWRSSNGIYITVSREKIPGRAVNNVTLFARSDNNFTISKNLSLTFGIQGGPGGKGLDYEYNGGIFVDAGVNLSLLKNKLNMSFNASQIIYSIEKKTIYGDSWTAYQRNLTHKTHVNLQVTWNFNAGKKIKDQNLPTTRETQKKIPTLMK